jgi:cyclohexanone monooxygenase
MALGCLSATNKPEFPGLEDFQGAVYHTGEWPHEGVDFAGRRVGIIGTGSSAIQTIPVIAAQAEHLTVFQRTPNFAIPAWNAPLEADEVRDIKADYAGLRAKAKARPTGVYFLNNEFSAHSVDDAERESIYQEYWRRGGLSFLGAFNDLLLDETANATAAAFVRARIREKVTDPALADLLAPQTIIGCKRLCVDSGYFETFNRDNVSLVDVSEDPVEKFTAKGLTVAGVDYEFDAAVFATGFDAMTGSFTRIDIRGRDGLPLNRKWEAGPRTFLGLCTAGFPNMFMITGPGSPSVLASMIQTIEQHVDWIIDCMGHMRDNGQVMIEAELADEDAWVEHVNEAAAGSLRSTCSSWYLGGSIPGRPRVFMPYIGGFPIYVEKCDSVAAAAYEGFRLA